MFLSSAYVKVTGVVPPITCTLKPSVAGRPALSSPPAGDVVGPAVGAAVGAAVGLAVFVQPDKAAASAIISVIVTMTDIFFSCMTHTLHVNPVNRYNMHVVVTY
jgi:hypothetical protein